MNYDEQRLEFQREEQRREMQRQLERDELARQELRRVNEAALYKKEFANRCANNDAPATIGGLCAGCHTAMVAASRSAESPRPVVGAESDPWRSILDSLPVQEHHLASDKSRGERTELMERIGRKYGLELGEDWNKVAVPHRGRHPDSYHAYVLGTMQFIDSQARGDRARFLELFDELVRETVVEAPQMLRRRAWYE